MANFALEPPITATPVHQASVALSAVVPEPQLPAAVSSRPVVARQPGMMQVSKIAKYDPELATALHERLDFSNVIQGGARLTVRDAYKVLKPSEFQRFEAVREGMKHAVRPLILAGVGIPAAATALAGAVTSLAMAGGEPFSFFAFLLGVIGGPTALAGLPTWACAAHATYEQRLAAIPGHIEMLKLTSAKTDNEIKSE